MLQFILDHTRLQSPTDLPELRLHLADQVMPIWRLMEAAAGGAEVPPPYWAFAWVGGIAIARHLLDQPHEAAGRRVLDFAAGSGLCSIAASKAGASEVLASDIDPHAAVAVQLNAAANGVQIGFSALDLLLEDPPRVDLILAGDVCYEERMTVRVMDWLGIAAARGSRVLIGDPGRSYLPAAGMRRLAEYSLRTTRELEERDSMSAAVYELDPS